MLLLLIPGQPELIAGAREEPFRCFFALADSLSHAFDGTAAPVTPNQDAAVFFRQFVEHLPDFFFVLVPCLTDRRSAEKRFPPWNCVLLHRAAVVHANTLDSSL